MSDDWDFDQQRSETADTIADLFENQGLKEGASVTLDVFLRPEGGADQADLARGLAMFGYAGERMEDRETGGDLFVVSVPDTALKLDDVWLHEERISRIGLARGYAPDGWGFFEPD